MDDILEEFEYGPVEGYPTFEEIGVMTVTMVGYFTGIVESVYNLFYLLPITKVPIVAPLRPVKKIKIPHPGYPGLLMSARYKDEVRGIVRSIPKGRWDHSIIIDFSITDKNINGKISRTNIQMCGCKSEDMGVESTEMLVDHINKIQENLDFVKANLEVYRKVCDEVVSDGLGGLVANKDGTLEISFDYLKIKSRPEETPEEKKIRFFLFGQLSDLKTLPLVNAKLDWIPKVPRIINQPLEYSHTRTGMTKYYFTLGFGVNQQKLYEIFQEVDPEFYVTYNSDVSNCVKIEIPCKDFQGMSGPDVLKHSFSIQQTGQTTYISQVSDEMEEFYYRFISAIDVIRDEIALKPRIQTAAY